MLREATERLVIRPRLSSTARLLIALGVVVVIGAAALGGYLVGRSAAQVALNQEIEQLELDLEQSRDSRAGLEAELDAARERVAAMRGRLEDTQSTLTKLTRQLQIDQSAYRELRRQLVESNERITRLAGELKFYRSIISPADGESGVKIRELSVEPTGREREYRYRLALIQALDHENTVTGRVRFEVTGTREGSAKTLKVPGDSGAAIAAEFKYFQNLSGTFKLPEGFQPGEITVIVAPDDGSAVRRAFVWPGSRPRRDT